MTTRNISTDRAIAMLSVIKGFQSLSPRDIEIIAAVCHWHRYEAGNEIVRYHDQTNSAFFIVQGEIRVMFHSLSGQEVILCDLPTGEMFGELTAIDGHPRSATAIAKSSVLLASMTAPEFQNLVYSNRQLAEIILKRLTGQVRRLTERVYDYSTLAVRNRIQVELLRLARNHMISANAAVISPAPTQTEIANLVSTHREAVSRELNILIRSKLILRQGHNLHVLDIAKLTEMVNEARGSF
ncbi:Crp/Fnr family transcriptional regulator [Nitrosomonas supralitoralis]|uniref:Crp/Fnr family transcriptional regulator n=1 Tax=Nitrosomonas supralitoralis TaxID=2116706 RepID=A0A2P7NUI2_9PROT|nr:Crp/Fnr family transcriptional regulator [Nitrosomonas supralitoralis]PSJ17099.1 Crp/Fnr family transcriptional regulator [Nitrosomonas supralitoralis]